MLGSTRGFEGQKEEEERMMQDDPSKYMTVHDMHVCNETVKTSSKGQCVQ